MSIVPSEISTCVRPSPWSQRSAVDPAREYVAFTSAFHLRSLLRVPAFVRRAYKIMKQADAAPGIVGWSLGFNLFTLDFYTLSVWQDNGGPTQDFQYGISSPKADSSMTSAKTAAATAWLQFISQPKCW